MYDTAYYILLVLAITAWVVCFAYEIAYRRLTKRVEWARYAARRSEKAIEIVEGWWAADSFNWDWPENPEKFIDAICRVADDRISMVKA